MKNICIILFSTASFFLCSCSNTKQLAQNQALFTGADVKIKSSAHISHAQKKELTSQMQSLIRPKPNSKILGARVKLFIYNLAGTPKKDKGLRHWLKYKVGEPPVIASMDALKKNSAVLQNRLENRGYFKDTVMLDTTVKNKKLHAVYTAYINGQYKIHNVSFPGGDDTLSRSIQKIAANTFLKKGSPYDLDVIKNERERIDANLKNKGFFYFNPDYLIVNVDSTVGSHQVDMHMEIKNQTPADAAKSYRIDNITVFADYNIRSDTNLAHIQSTDFAGYTIVDPDKNFQPKIFSRTLVFKRNDVYNRNKHNMALNRLVTMGVFKFVKARFEKSDTASGNYLDLFYYLTPTEKKSIRFTATVLSKSNNSSGGVLSINWLNRNFLKGAELFTIGAYGGIEQQISAQQNAGTKRFGIDMSLSVPRIISPFNFKTNSGYVPRTKFALGYQLYRGDTSYTLNAYTATYGYIWKESLEKEHELNIISINYVRPSNINPAYQKQIDTNIILARSIEQQFIIGSTYNFNLNTQAHANAKRNNYYFNGNLDLSGNLIGLITGANINKGKTVSIFSTPVSQYARAEADFRHYLRLSKYSVIASRFIAGAGYAYGNSSVLPFIKAFFAGGTNDIRAFRSRALGPGSFYAGDPRIIPFLPEQPGDIKLELNTELRAKLFSVVRWALFADAGNIWTIRSDSTRPGSQFTNRFLNQTAVGIGTGLRFDLSILVLRLDIAMPVRKPWLPEGSRWVIDKINFGDREWRRQNLIINLAIGYPF